MVWYGRFRHNFFRMLLFSVVCFGATLHGTVRNDPEPVWYGDKSRGRVGGNMVPSGMVCSIRFGMVLYGTVRYGTVRSETALHGTVKTHEIKAATNIQCTVWDDTAVRWHTINRRRGGGIKKTCRKSRFSSQLCFYLLCSGCSAPEALSRYSGPPATKGHVILT